MASPLDAQLGLIAVTLLAGMGLGCVYDLLRVLRERSGAVFGVAADVLFCVLAGAALFLLGMGPAAGTLRLYMPPLALCGALLWFFFFGAPVRRAARRVLDALAVPLRKLRDVTKSAKISLKKRLVFVKKGFTSAKNWFTITGKRFTIIHNSATKDEGPGGQTDEAETLQHIYEDRDPGADRVRRGAADRGQKRHRRGGGRPRGAAGRGRRAPAKKRGAGV